jgi:DNA-directed RNA polymerase specialized sigma24 family protein
MKGQINIEEAINKAAKESAKEAIKEFDKEKRQEQRKKVFHNTKLLLSHYNDLKQHVENAIDDARQLETDLIQIGEIERDELYILSIKKSKTKTLIMIAHIDMALEILKQKQYKLCSPEKHAALEMFYIDEMTYEEIVEKLSCGERTARRWMNEMIEELSVYIFGVDALRLNG